MFTYMTVKTLFFEIDKIWALIAQKHHLGFFENLSYQKEQDFWYYRMCSPKWDTTYNCMQLTELCGNLKFYALILSGWARK